jgi:hypothetical protein
VLDCFDFLPHMQELCLPYELTAADLEEAEPQAMLLLVTYLFTALPQLLPRATLEFECGLGDKQVSRGMQCSELCPCRVEELENADRSEAGICGLCTASYPKPACC